MHKFLQIFLFCQMFVYSFIYAQSIYDIYTLNHLGADYENEYYLENISGENLNTLYDILTEARIPVEIVKTPVSDDNIMEYEIYSTPGAKIRKMIPITNDKRFSYFELTRADFVDSTGRFSCNLDYSQVLNMTENHGLSIREYSNDDISYKQVFRNNSINIILLLILSQFVLFVYTFMRSKMNAIKKLVGYSNERMVVDSLSLFVKMEGIASGIVILTHSIYCIYNRKVCTPYFSGLLLTICIVFAVNLILLFVTQFSIRSIDICVMIKNKMYSNTWNNCMIVLKIVFTVILTIGISVFMEQYSEYKNTVSEVDKYRELSQYYTANGFNSDEYEKIFREKDSIEEVSSNMKDLYHKYAEELLVMNVNVTGLMDETYYELYDTSAEKLMHSYRENYVVVNEAYFKEYMQIFNENGERIQYNDLPEHTVLVPEEYRGKKAEQFCKERYNDFFRYDDYYSGSDSETKEKEVQVIYIPGNQKISILTPYQLETGETISNSIIFIDHGDFSGTWYLEALSNGQIAFSLSDRNAFSLILQEFHLNELLNVGTLLTPLTDDIHFYEFTANQAGVFAFLFLIALLFILYLSSHVEIMVNRKQYAIKWLLGFSIGRSIIEAVLPDGIILLLAIPLWIFGCDVRILEVSLIVDLIFLVIMYHSIIQKNIEGNMKGE